MKKQHEIGDIITNLEEEQDAMFDLLREVNDFVCNFLDMNIDEKIERFDYFGKTFSEIGDIFKMVKSEDLDREIKLKVTDKIGDRPIWTVDDSHDSK